MGRSAKFTFPVPGRKPKPNPPPSISAPLSKAQKILGTGGINIDSPTLPKDPQRPPQWDARSNSGISISISESSGGHTNETGWSRLGRDDDDAAAAAAADERSGRPWDDESAIIPRDLCGPAIQLNGSRAVSTHDAATEVSSLRRRESSSTIVSYYDKSKLPLSISQQTSASAMARGLPRKANSVLDVDGTRSSPPRVKKKPSRLDLSHLLPKGRSAKHASSSYDHLVLGPDLITRSPSVLSVSPDPPPPTLPSPRQQPAGPKPRRNTMRERLQAAQQLGAPELPPGPRPSVSASNMRDLYAHYEQQPLRTAFRTTTDADVSAAAAATACDFRSSPDYASSSSPATAFAAHRGGFLSPLSHSTTTKPPHSARSNGPSSVLSGPDTPITSIMTTPSSLVSFPPADCAASVSSRHTRTSKASKRTDMSLTDLDLQQTSVLSLSSDSEDDFPDVPKPSSRGVGGAAAAAAAAAAAVPRRPSRASAAAAADDGKAVDVQHLALPSTSSTTTTPPLDVASHRSGPRRVSAALVGVVKAVASGTPAEKPSTAAPPPPAGGQLKINARTSSLSVVSNANQSGGGSARSSSRLSLASTATATSAGMATLASDGGASGGGQDYVVHEARAVTMHPAQRPHFQSIQSQYLYAPEPRRFSQVSGHSDQTSASQSPPSSSVAHGHPSSSLDAYLQPKSGSSPLLSPDSLSIASGRSVGTLGSGASGHSGSNPNNSSHNGRFMAVTRQEEMLLAALRKKRARMRENIIAELEAEQEEEDTSLEDDVPSRLLQPPHRHHGRHHHHQNHQPLSPPPSQPLPAPPPPMKHQRQQQQQQPQGSSSARQGSRRASSQVAARLAPLHELPLRRGGLGQAVESSSYLHSSPTSPLPEPPRSASSSGRQPQSRSRERARGPVEDKQGPSRPAGQSLADFIDFDHYEAGNDRLVESLPSEASGYSSRSQKLHRLPRLSFSSLPSGGQAARGGDGDATLFGGFPRTDSDPASPRSSPNKTDRDDVDVRIVEDGGLPDVDDNDSVGIPRPDSPAMALPLVAPLPRKKQVRLSAVGYQPELESALWSSEA